MDNDDYNYNNNTRRSDEENNYEDWFLRQTRIEGNEMDVEDEDGDGEEEFISLPPGLQHLQIPQYTEIRDDVNDFINYSSSQHDLSPQQSSPQNNYPTPVRSNRTRSSVSPVMSDLDPFIQPVDQDLDELSPDRPRPSLGQNLDRPVSAQSNAEWLESSVLPSSPRISNIERSRMNLRRLRQSYDSTRFSNVQQSNLSYGRNMGDEEESEEEEDVQQQHPPPNIISTPRESLMWQDSNILPLTPTNVNTVFIDRGTDEIGLNELRNDFSNLKMFDESSFNWVNEIKTNSNIDDKDDLDYINRKYNITYKDMTISDNLINIKFKKCKFSNITVSSELMRKIIFQDCDIENVTFSNVHFDSIIFNKCNIKNVLISSSKQNKHLLDKMFIEYSTIINLEIINYEITNGFLILSSNIQLIVVENSNITCNIFIYCGKISINLLSTNIEKSIFILPQTDKCILSDSKIDSCRIKNITIEAIIDSMQIINVNNELLNLNNCEISNSNFENLSTSSKSWNSVKFSTCKFSRNTLSGIIFENVNFDNVVFTDNNNAKSVFDGCTFNDSIIERSDYSKSVFNKCTFIQTRIDNSVLDNVRIDCSEDNMYINKCEFSNMVIRNIHILSYIFYHNTFENVEFINSNIHNCDLLNVENTYVNTMFRNGSIFTNMYVNSTNYDDSTVFNNCFVGENIITPPSSVMNIYSNNESFRYINLSPQDLLNDHNMKLIKTIQSKHFIKCDFYELDFDCFNNYDNLIFINCSLKNCLLHDTKSIDNLILKNCDLSYSQYLNIYNINGKITRCICDNVSFRNNIDTMMSISLNLNTCNFKNTTFARCKLKPDNVYEQVDFTGAKFDKCVVDVSTSGKYLNFINCVFHETLFNHCHMNNINIVDAVFDTIILKRCVIRSSIFDKILLNEIRREFRTNRFKKCLFNECNFSRCELNKIKILNSEFISCKLYEVQLHKSDLSGSIFDGSAIIYSHLNLSDLQDCKINNCNLVDSNFYTCNMENVTIQYSILSSSTNFSNANLKNTKFICLDLDNVNFEDANMDESTSFLNIANFENAIGISTMVTHTIDTNQDCDYDFVKQPQDTKSSYIYDESIVTSQLRPYTHNIDKILRDNENKCINFIYLDEYDIDEYISTKDNIVIVCINNETRLNNVICMNKKEILEFLSNRKNNLFYECTDFQPYAKHPKVIEDVLYLRLELNGRVYISLNDIKAILLDNEHKIFCVDRKMVNGIPKVAKYSITWGIYTDDYADITSSCHCNEGSSINIYEVFYYDIRLKNK